MSKKNLSNIGASIRQKLSNKASSSERPFTEILQYYAMERFLYRVSQSDHSSKYILKGALLLRAFESPMARATMDIDLLGITDNEMKTIQSQIKEIMLCEVEPDGIVFNENTIRTERIKEDAEYEGVRVLFKGNLESALIHMQIDVGFGDIIYPKPIESNFPTILNLPAPRLLCYSRESVIAEKFEAMVKLKELNSRIKDFYDIWLLSRQFEFDKEILKESIRRTFQQRKTDISENIVAFSQDFIDAKQTQWQKLKAKLEQDNIPDSFSEIVNTIKYFLMPIASELFQEMKNN